MTQIVSLSKEISRFVLDFPHFLPTSVEVREMFRNENDVMKKNCDVLILKLKFILTFTQIPSHLI